MTTFPDFPAKSNESVLSVHNPSQFNLPVNEPALERLLQIIEKEENSSFSFVEVVYVDEEGIIEINKEYLDRDYVTDIISFNYEDDPEEGIEGTLYCCAPRIAEQSRELESDPEQEFYRIFIHGLLHLVGYEDSTTEEKEAMTKLENHYLEYLSN
ncbi:rRNA maturation RNase YbeY [Rhodohalobacter sp. 614A]|uniref:rRNA maturation RNase YbeY n=1 Tax=Rhodohalobacter sp. 614A TaxID=2908649 RepID=UPI001F45F876|nr:rRNA maturation RNase YbeY [Rhodohalobacter sp. 614A]